MTQTQIVEERHDFKAYVTSAAKKVLEAKEKKKAAKEMFDQALHKNDDFSEAHDAALEAGKVKRAAKDKAIMGSAELKRLEEAYKDASEDLKEAEDSLSGAIEAQFMQTKSFTVEMFDGTNVTAKRKFSFGNKQLSLFAE